MSALKYLPTDDSIAVNLVSISGNAHIMTFRDPALLPSLAEAHDFTRTPDMEIDLGMLALAASCDAQRDRPGGGQSSGGRSSGGRASGGRAGPNDNPASASDVSFLALFAPQPGNLAIVIMGIGLISALSRRRQKVSSS